jgi:hypothetical protein
VSGCGASGHVRDGIPGEMPRPSRREWRWALMLALLALALGSLPYLVGYWRTPLGQVFIGAVYDWEDTYSHLAKMQLGVHGEWRFRILFTPEEHQGAYFNLFYIALGHLARVLGVPCVLLYHATRLVCGLGLLLVAFWFVGSFLAEPRTRRVAFVLICFSSGLGWLLVLATRSLTWGGITPVDFWLIEISTFFVVLTFPHASLAQAAHLAAYAAMVHVLRSAAHRHSAGRWLWGWWGRAAGCAVALALVHPYSLLPLDLPLALCALAFSIRGRCLRPWAWLAGFALLPLPLVAYQYAAISSSEVFSAWQAQSTTLSPPPQHYVLGYGLVLLLAVWGAIRGAKRRDEGTLALLAWPLAVAPLLYLPVIFNLQRRMIEGVHVPLAALAAFGLEDGLLPLVLRSRLANLGLARARLRRLAEGLVVAFTTPSTGYLLASLVLAAGSGFPALFLSRAEVAAVDWLGAHAAPDQTVLSSYALGGFIPARTGRRVFWGHWAETIHLPQKEAEALAFYSGEMDDPAAFLRQYGIRFVFHGPQERALGALDPRAIAGLEPAYVTPGGEVALYRVVEPTAEGDG